MTLKSTPDKVYELFVSEYERGLLSLAYRYYEVLVELNQRISSDYFLFPPNKLIYVALSNLAKQKSVSKIDLESLLIECTNLGLESYGVGAEYLGLLTQGGYDRENLEFYIEKVENSYIKYVLHKKLESSYSLLIKNSKDTEKSINGQELINTITAELSSLSAFTNQSIEGISFADRVEAYVLERAANPTDVQGLRTGFETLDKAMNGLLEGGLTIIAGVAGEGKSTILLNIVDYVAYQCGVLEEAKPNKILQTPKSILLISTEMYTDEDISRELAIRTLLEERGICNGILYNDPKYKPILMKGIEQVKNMGVHHVYLPDFNISKVCSLIYQYKMKYDIGLAVFDYIKMSTIGDESKDKKEYQVLGDFTAALKNMAGKLHIPILSACQVNSRSGLVADSDRIIRYCNNLLILSRKSEEELEEQNFYMHGTHWLDTKKSRSGGTVRIPIRFWKKCCTMQEADPYVPAGEKAEDAYRPKYELTTPEEWEKMKNAYFKIETVESSLNEKPPTKEDDELF